MLYFVTSSVLEAAIDVDESLAGQMTYFGAIFYGLILQFLLQNFAALKPTT